MSVPKRIVDLVKMSGKDLLILILFAMVFTQSVLIFSYQTTLFFFPLTAAQENTIHFLQGEEEILIDYTFEVLSHLQDVASVMKWLRYVFYITTILSMVIFL